MSHPIGSVVLRTEDLSYPKSIPNSFIFRRFEGVEAPKGLEKVPEKHTEIFFKTILFRIFLDICAFGI
jgi:hypothetical protein